MDITLQEEAGFQSKVSMVSEALMDHPCKAAMEQLDLYMRLWARAGELWQRSHTSLQKHS